MVSLCKIRLHKMLHRCKFTVFLEEWICCKEVSGGARLVFKLREKCRPHAHESNHDETQVVDLGYEVRCVGTDSFPPGAFRRSSQKLWVETIWPLQ